MLAGTSLWEEPSSAPTIHSALLRPESHQWGILYFTKQLRVLFTYHPITPPVITKQLALTGTPREAHRG